MSKLRALFVNPKERRLRGLLRLLVHGLLVLLIGLVVFVVGSSVLPGVGASQSGGIPSWFTAVLSAASVAAATWLAGRTLDKRDFEDFGFHLDGRWWLDLIAGLVIGVLLMAGIFAVELAAGWVEIEGYYFVGASEEPAGASTFLLALLGPWVTFVCVAVYEELLSRGYHLRNLAEALHWPGGCLGPRAAMALAVLLSSSVFGLLHASNPGASVISTLSVALAGCMLAIGPLLTGELGLAIGLHLSWNFCQGNVFGFPVSGTDAGPRVIAVVQGGDPLITGGEFGPEAGLIGVAAMFVGALFSVVWVRLSRGRLAWHTALAEAPEPPSSGLDRL